MNHQSSLNDSITDLIRDWSQSNTAVSVSCLMLVCTNYEQEGCPKPVEISLFFYHSENEARAEKEAKITSLAGEYACIQACIRTVSTRISEEINREDAWLSLLTSLSFVVKLDAHPIRFQKIKSCRQPVLDSQKTKKYLLYQFADLNIEFYDSLYDASDEEPDLNFKLKTPKVYQESQERPYIFHLNALNSSLVFDEANPETRLIYALSDSSDTSADSQIPFGLKYSYAGVKPFVH